MYVFLSPHFDDAIGSAGGIIKRLTVSGNRCCIMTIMAAMPWLRPKSANYVLHRRSENRRAARILGCSVKDAPFFDALYRKEVKKSLKLLPGNNLSAIEVTEYDLIKKIREYILANTSPGDVLFAPAGLGNHIDHRLVNLAVRDMDRQVCFYEEFYYDIKDKESSLTSGYRYVYLTPEEMGEKLRAMLEYKRTLRKLFREGWEEKTARYYREQRIYDGKAYERFNDISFLNEK